MGGGEAVTENRTGRLEAVCTSERKGVPKKDRGAGVLRVDWGLEGDAHAGNWHRQVSLLAMESIAKMQAKGLNVRPGSFAENLTTTGLVLYTLPVGTRLKIGPTLVEVTQIGKKCHKGCAIFKQVGDCIMPREGIFTKVIVPGALRRGDSLDVLP